MNVQDLINELMKVGDKTKLIYYVCNACAAFVPITDVQDEKDVTLW